MNIFWGGMAEGGGREEEIGEGGMRREYGDKAQSTYRGRGEIGGMFLPSQLERTRTL
jgi:hypothetical protein